MDNTLILDLISKQGTPFYLFDEKGFIENYQRLEDVFRKIYPEYRICYSYKTNYTPFICNLVKKLGGYAEIVSDMEYMLAKKIGYDNQCIVYNGPAKGEHLYEHLFAGGIVNIDSYDEAKRIVGFCNNHPEKLFKVGLRINMNLGGDFISRFGVEPESEEETRIVEIMKRVPNMKLVGLHCHISRSRGLEAWRKRAEIMLGVADRIIEGTPEYISLGSGMFADMDDYLKNQFFGGEVPSYEDYGEACIKPFAEHYNNAHKRPMLFTEPGTTVVSRYISFISKVLSIKQIRGRKLATMDGDFHNLGEICTMKKLPTEVIHRGKTCHFYEDIDIMGFTCLEQDVMVPHWSGELSTDDIIIFGNVGGYSIVSKPQFIKPQTAMFAVCEDGSLQKIMRAETFDDVFNKFSFGE